MPPTLHIGVSVDQDVVGIAQYQVVSHHCFQVLHVFL